MPDDKKYTEVIWYGRGGQGAITASQIIAEAAYLEGYRGVTTAPSFGAERRGAAVSAYLRLSHEPIRKFSQVSNPDIIVVLDPTLLPSLNLEDKMGNGAVLILNSTKTPEDLYLKGYRRIGIADVTSVSVENRLTLAGVAILNTPILGAFVRITGLVSLPSVERVISRMFPGEKGERNINTARIINKTTRIYDYN
jgi:2-oxoacid:acceptor oxidoreductase gamma subunit (pyruvate/2-ketoisovalerate family)